jgi:WD40 repeat protein
LRKLIVLLLPCLLIAGQIGIEPVTITGADGIQQTSYRINTGNAYLSPAPVPSANPPGAPADTEVLWVDRNHRFGICQATEISGDGMHVLANWYLNAQRADYYRSLASEVPLWESPGDFPWGYNGRQIGSSVDAKVLTLSLQNAAVKWSRSSGFPDWQYEYPGRATGFSKAARDGSKVVAVQNGTLYGLDAATGDTLYTAPVSEPGVLQGIDISDDGSIVAVTVYDSCLVYEDGEYRGGIPIGTSSSGTQYSAAISGDGSMVVTGDFFGKVKLWTWTGSAYAMKWQASVGTPWVAGVGISADGSTIACGTGYDNGKLCVFDSSSSTPLWVYQGYGTTGSYVASVALSRDGSRIAAASWGEFSTSGTYKVFTVQNRDSAGPIFGITRNEERGSLFSCDISDDGQFAVCGGKAVHAYEMGNGGEVYAIIIGSAASTNVGMASIQQPTRYLQVGTQVSPAATVQNYGNAAATFTAHLVVNDTRDSVIYHDSALVTGLAPGATAPVSFAAWTPLQFDLFTSTFYTALVGDSYPGDDTMVMKSKCFHDGMPIRIGPPNREVTVGYSFTPAVSVVNNGSYSDNMRCLLVIRDSAGTVVYAESTTTGTLPPDDTLPVPLPPTSMARVGAYTATAVIKCTDDFYPGNDTFRLAFQATYEIMYDDGGWEGFYWVGRNDNDKFYVRYTPTIPAPYAITGGRIYVNVANQVFDYVSICEDAAGRPDTTAEIGRVENVSTPTAPGWIDFDFDITRPDISDVWMVIHWPNTSPALGIGADATPPIDLRSYLSSNQDTFRLWTSHDWMARIMQSPNVGVAGTAGTQLKFRLLEPMPNPFRSAARLSYEIPAAARIALKVYDRSGRLVAVPVSGLVQPGRYNLSWHATDREGRTVAPGVYFCRLLNLDSGVSSVQKLTLVR